MTEALEHPGAVKAKANGLSLPAANARVLTALLSVLLSLGGSLVAVRSLTEYRLAEAERRLEKQSLAIEEVQKNGNREQEARIARLELAVPDRTAQSVAEQGKQIAMLAEAVKQDHDVLIRLAVLMERGVKEPGK